MPFGSTTWKDNLYIVIALYFFGVEYQNKDIDC